MHFTKFPMLNFQKAIPPTVFIQLQPHSAEIKVIRGDTGYSFFRWSGWTGLNPPSVLGNSPLSWLSSPRRHTSPGNSGHLLSLPPKARADPDAEPRSPLHIVYTPGPTHGCMQCRLCPDWWPDVPFPAPAASLYGCCGGTIQWDHDGLARCILGVSPGQTEQQDA